MIKETLADETKKNMPVSKENFAELLEESIAKVQKKVGSLVTGKVVAIEKDSAIIDIGYKSEGRVPLREFLEPDTKPKVGDEVEVFFESAENKSGDAVLSRERAKKEEAWVLMEKAVETKEKVKGNIFSRVKGGFSVDLEGAIAFLPGSQVDVKVIKDNSYLLGTEQVFHILKMDRKRGNIVVSRRSVLEESRAEAKAELVSTLEEGQIMEGTVKNITDYGAFIDLGDVDGLLHVTDISWRRVTHPTEVLSLGQKITVKLIKYNLDTQRISLGMKQLDDDPWKGAQEKYALNKKYKGRITNITDYGAFVEIEKGIEGLVHISEMSWTKKNTNPSKLVSAGEEVEVVILDFDVEKRRLSLGMKQAMTNPWVKIKEDYTVGSEIEGEITNITEFGMFLKITDEVDGLIHFSDLSWEKPGEEVVKDFKQGDLVKAKVLEVDMEKERIGLGIKQLKEDPFKEASADKLKKGNSVTCVIEKISDSGLEVMIDKKFSAFIKKSDLSRDKIEQKVDRFAVGEKVDAMITSIDKNTRKINLSVKSLELAEEKKAMKDFGSVDAGASLGDILGAALEAKASGQDEKESKKTNTEDEKKSKQKKQTKDSE